MSGHHRRKPTTSSSRRSSKRSRKDESNRGGVVGVSSSFNSLPMDVLVLIFEYIPQYPRLRVLKFVSKRFHSAVRKSFKTLSRADFNWNWEFVLPRFPFVTSLVILGVETEELPHVLPPRISSLTLRHETSEDCNCKVIKRTSSLTSLTVFQKKGCPPLDRLISNSLSSLTFLKFGGNVPPPSNLYLPSLRHLAIQYSDSAQPFILNHASQLTRLKCDASHIQDIRFPLLRRLDVTLNSGDNTSFMQHCPSLTHFNATLSHIGWDVSQVTHLLPLVSTISFRAGEMLPFLHLATRLTAISSGIYSNERTMQHLLPVASRLKRLCLGGDESKQQDCAPLLALCPMLEELELQRIPLDSNATFSLPHLVKLEIDCSSNVMLNHLNKFLVVAPRLRQMIVCFEEIDTWGLCNFLHAAEKAGVERVELHVAPMEDYDDDDDLDYSFVDFCAKTMRDLEFQWLYVPVITAEL